ncbi:hypothetical protein FJT64_002711 [Amphibalanus amphitrite]|uniref:Uncharacterized protein n=1 Tax=Amphibalanus amphitrite TaxID=1232801 RepID=A0A6A4WQZ8_AMPAM|nr:hypothetical protein FJT64_002711 [Amphibalanus amphitrite]
MVQYKIWPAKLMAKTIRCFLGVGVGVGAQCSPVSLRAGAWLRSPDPAALADSDSGAAMDYRTERYHIADLFAEGTG